jgi:SAM-dependent methyltransferase
MRRTLATAVFVVALLTSGCSRGRDVPYQPSPEGVVQGMLDMAKVGPGDFVIDLGSGDGRIPIEAARRGARGLGIEIDPALVSEAQTNARAAGVEDRVQFRQQDLFETDLSQASVITLYLFPQVNLKLRPRLQALKPGTRIVSHNWDMGDWKPDRQETIFGKRVYLWVIPERGQKSDQTK